MQLLIAGRFNKLVGILDGCLTHQRHYDETVAFSSWLPANDDTIQEAA